jgi:hypothetical protein
MENKKERKEIVCTINNVEYIQIQFEIVFYSFDEADSRLTKIGAFLHQHEEKDGKGFLGNKTYLLKYLVPVKNTIDALLIVKSYL